MYMYQYQWGRLSNVPKRQICGVGQGPLPEALGVLASSFLPPLLLYVICRVHASEKQLTVLCIILSSRPELLLQCQQQTKTAAVCVFVLAGLIVDFHFNGVLLIFFVQRSLSPGGDLRNTCTLVYCLRRSMQRARVARALTMSGCKSNNPP